MDPVAVLAHALDGLSLRQRVTANNVANADTPHFKGSVVSFEDALQERLAGAVGRNLSLTRTHPGHLPTTGPDPLGPPRVTEIRTTAMRNDGNNIDIEQQMSMLAETTLRYSAVSETTARKLAMLRTIATDGRG